MFRTQGRRRIDMEWVQSANNRVGNESVRKRHIRDVATLRKYLVDKGFVLPPFIGGLERAVNV